MSATRGQMSNTEHPTPSTIPQPETTNSYIWVTSSDAVFTQARPVVGLGQGEGIRIPEASDSQASYLASQLELERGCVQELM
jgi:hypothetical protein